MSEDGHKRLQEGALSALKTPVKPPVKPKLVPLGSGRNSNGAKSK
jgi:hypothetical protein